jgi:TPR repeat protein
MKTKNNANGVRISQDWRNNASKALMVITALLMCYSCSSTSAYNYSESNSQMTKKEELEMQLAALREKMAVADTAGKRERELGEKYEYGIGTEKDLSLAASWYRKSADLGNPNAADKLASMYKYGIGGLPEDKAEADRWGQRGAAADKKKAESLSGEIWWIDNAKRVDKRVATTNNQMPAAKTQQAVSSNVPSNTSSFSVWGVIADALAQGIGIQNQNNQIKQQIDAQNEINRQLAMQALDRKAKLQETQQRQLENTHTTTYTPQNNTSQTSYVSQTRATKSPVNCLKLKEVNTIYTWAAYNQCNFTVQFSYCVTNPKDSCACKTNPPSSVCADGVGAGKESILPSNRDYGKMYMTQCEGRIGEVSPILKNGESYCH